MSAWGRCERSEAMSELKVGNLAKTESERLVEIMAVDGRHVWVKALDNGDHWTERGGSLTPIEPAAPPPH